jgi:raffinose/stachyose/melibiose transport system permease protein
VNPRTGRRVQPVAAVLAAVVVVGVPFWLALATAGKSFGEAVKPDLAPPSDPQYLANAKAVVDQGHLLLGLLNSLLVVVPTVVIVLLLGSMAAWVFARRRGRVAAAFYALTISGIMLPPAIVILVLVLRQLGLAGTRPGLIGVYCGLYLSIAIFLITGFVRTIPYELEEAAGMDGAGPVRMFARIVVPLLRPVLATATILVTLFAWNDVFYAFFALGGGDRGTLPLQLYQVASAQLYLNNWHLVFMYVLLMSLPLVGVFLVAQRRIIAGVTSGAVK